ncbi:unnamed protein product [Orchesella dallaii]|uniref:DDE Tnp4 domain-containing protein n=1 Tax=Orchesella dallaii TaxID=48710 RepID=A0ABP1QRZ2_9HEXA
MDTSNSASFPTSSGTSLRKLKRNVKSQQLAETFGIPLIPQPRIDYNIPDLENAVSINVVLEKDGRVLGSYSQGDKDNETKYFRISDENNKEICKFVECSGRVNVNKRNGIKYLECHSLENKCIMLVAYPVGLGEVALLSANEELIGECQSNVEFICLSLKVKYNFYDANGQRLMKMTAIMPEKKNQEKFTLIVKRSENNKLALIKMGLLKSCCHIKFKLNQTNCVERLQIIALWIGFMHNELQDRETSMLTKHRHEDVQKRLKESLNNNRSEIHQQCHGSDCEHLSNNSPKDETSQLNKTHNQNGRRSLKIWNNLFRLRLPSTRKNNNIELDT